MKSLTLFFIAICLILPTIVQAESPFSSLQSAKEKKSRIAGFTQTLYPGGIII